MKTKKEILKWWEDLGQTGYRGRDISEFDNMIDKRIVEVKDERVDKHIGKRTLSSKRWKWPIKLYFYDGECFKIVGF